MTRANVSRYARWQLQDFLVDRGVALVLIAVLLAAPQVIMMQKIKGPFSDPGQTLVRLGTSLAIIFALISLNGQVSNDRTKGYYRFLFSKPVSSLVFYSQQFAIWFAGLMIVTSLLIGVFAVAAGPVSPWPVLWYVALVYLAFGGFGFFISTVWHRDWLAIIGVWSLTQLLVAIYKDSGVWVERLFFLLPPVEHLGNASKALTRQAAVGMGDIAWVLGYSAVFFGLGLYVLHKRPFHS